MGLAVEQLIVNRAPRRLTKLLWENINLRPAIYLCGQIPSCTTLGKKEACLTDLVDTEA